MKWLQKCNNGYKMVTNTIEHENAINLQIQFPAEIVKTF